MLNFKSPLDNYGSDSIGKTKKQYYSLIAYTKKYLQSDWLRGV